MEHKIGEIFEDRGCWYQCIRDITCINCGFNNKGCLADKHITGDCSGRLDGASVVFKKLEKVGELNMIGNKLIQRYKIYPTTHCINVYGWYYQNLDVKSWTIDIEIKQNKEDMEDLDKIKVRDYTKVEELNVMEENKLNLKPFDLEAAKAGKPVCTRDGRKARIICFDRISDNDYKIVACVTVFDGDFEEVLFYGIDGYIVDSQNPKDEDLMMLPEKKEGWINICRNLNTNKTELDTKDIYSTKEEALQNLSSMTYVTTVKIEWEE